MFGKFSLWALGLILALWTLTGSSVFAQPPAAGAGRIPGLGGMPASAPGGAAGFGYGGGYYPYPAVIVPYQGGYNYGGYDPRVASVPSAAYFTYGNTTYTTESPSPLPVYPPRAPFAPMPPPLPLTALLKVQVPLDAEVWLEGQKMRSVGTMRHYRSPPLDPTKEYAYEVRARWRSDGKAIDDVRHVAIRAGAIAIADFSHLDPLVPRPSAPSPPPAAAPDKTEPRP